MIVHSRDCEINNFNREGIRPCSCGAVGTVNRSLFKTAHQLARELLALPDLPLRVEEWYRTPHAHPAAGIYEADGGKSIFIYKLPNTCKPTLSDRSLAARER